MSNLLRVLNVKAAEIVEEKTYTDTELYFIVCLDGIKGNHGLAMSYKRGQDTMQL